MVSGAAGFRRAGAGVGAPVAGYDGSVSHREGAATGEIADLRCVCAFSAQAAPFRGGPFGATLGDDARCRNTPAYASRRRAKNDRESSGRPVRLAPAGQERPGVEGKVGTFCARGPRTTGSRGEGRYVLRPRAKNDRESSGGSVRFAPAGQERPGVERRVGTFCARGHRWSAAGRDLGPFCAAGTPGSDKNPARTKPGSDKPGSDKPRTDCPKGQILAAIRSFRLRA
ncbi:hypothetical protein MLP_20180 [Microlunatus phosphovorus NM-1]|uniref:Uncharacterized protein n=1 Tax=Microlunatus phosphovorus (strain ATCC 700054 / DSM 10555 / JCM 9379 / NBRC 101784 / NCIMB 13414 / VKM Ac-1990 / NM-1) TaxID=1032480 RepID=F5XTG0_MICPN|nr:hypothetical protein MLP_20180 [Microlunatus phosphovorus NM-1]